MAYRDRIEFDVFDKYTHVANIVIDEEGDVEVTYYKVNTFNDPLPKNNPTVEDVAYFLESRCFPDTRSDAQRLLRMMNLQHYNPIRIVKETHGLIHEDYIWLRFKGENITYDEIKIRD